MNKNDKQDILEIIDKEASMLDQEAELLKHEAKLLHQEVNLLKQNIEVVSRPNNKDKEMNNNNNENNNGDVPNPYRYTDSYGAKSKKSLVGKFYDKYNLKLFIYRKYIYLTLIGIIITLSILFSLEYSNNIYLKNVIDKKNKQVELMEQQFEVYEKEFETKNEEIAQFSELIDQTLSAMESIQNVCRPQNNYKDSVEFNEYTMNDNYDNIYQKGKNKLETLKEKHQQLKDKSSVSKEKFDYTRRDRHNYR